MFNENFHCLDTHVLKFMNFTVSNVLVGFFRAAPMKSGRSVTSSSQPGRITGSLNTPPPSWHSCAELRPATLQTLAPWSSTAGAVPTNHYYLPFCAVGKDLAFRRLRSMSIIFCQGSCLYSNERQEADELVGEGFEKPAITVVAKCSSFQGVKE